MLVLLVAALAMKGWLVPVPELPERPSAAEFDTVRAMARLRRVLGDQRPHPVDSEANDAVRARLIAELRAIGLAPTVTDDFVCNGSAKVRAVSCARVRNVLATIGPAQGRHVMMVSHYDSTPVGPGAGDDGIGMAAMLESAALLRDRPLKRPVTFLFNEGEETGLLGARAFIERNPLADRVEAVVNLEARGVTGPAIMFETSRPNAAAVAAYAKSAARPSANSLTTDFYRLIPNSTDVTVFAERPWTILNFAIIGNETRYHSPGDDLDALDPRSVGHMGAQALAATRELAEWNAPERGGTLIYADLLGHALVTMPLRLGLVLLAGLSLAFAWLAWGRRAGVGRGIGVAFLAMLDAALTVFLLQWLIGLFRPGDYWRAHPEAIALAIGVTALASAAAALVWLARPIARDRLRIGYWLFFLMLGAALSLAAPGAAIFFLLPPAIALAGIVAGRWEREAALVAWAALFLSWAPLLHLSETLLDFDSGWTFAPVAVLILFPLLIELKPELLATGRGRATAALGGAALLAWAATLLVPAYSEDRKQAFGIDYVREGDGARWMVVNDGAPLPRGFDGFDRPAEVPWSSRRRWSAPAPASGPAEAVAEKVGERATAGGRLVSLRLGAGATEMMLLRAEPEAQLKAVRIGGTVRRFGNGGAEENFAFRCTGRSCAGATVELLVGSAAPVEAILTSIRRGLPEAASPLIEARPSAAAPQYHPDSSVTVAKIRL